MTRCHFVRWGLRSLATVLLLSSAGCATGAALQSKERHRFDPAPFDARVSAWLKEYHCAGVGIAVIRDGERVWAGYFGEQGPGLPATSRTVFNTASVAKTVTAETMMALAAEGLIDLDEPIARYVHTPDLESDPRYQMLTSRLLLSHRSGLLNWAYEYDDKRLAFVRDPGTQFGYSGAGFDLAASYAQAKLGTDFETLSFDHLLRPLKAQEMALGRTPAWLEGRLAQPMDAQGAYQKLGDLDARLVDGQSKDWSAADDLFTTVEAYASLLTGLLHGTAAASQQRSTILTSLEGDPIWNCVPGEKTRCPDAYGHGLGWMVYRYGAHTVLKHGGNDAGENALVYFSPDTRNGAVIFVNGGNGIFVTERILELIGDEPDIGAYYRQLVKKHYGVELPPLP